HHSYTLSLHDALPICPMTRTELCERLSICETAVCRQIRRLLELNMVQQVAPSVDALLANPRTKAAFSLVGEDVASGEKQDCWAARMIATEKWLSENPNSSANAIAAGLGFSRATADVVLKKLRVASKCYVSGQGPERINGGTPAYLYSAGSLP